MSDTSFNTSIVADNATARTAPECADQRADHLFVLGARNVLELCVGPSLPELERAYRARGMSVTGNDIEPRWQRAHPSGQWIIGNALEVDLKGFDAVVFAPPLSLGCTGRREDSLSVLDVRPSYLDFVGGLNSSWHGIVVLVLPARSLSTRHDREQYFHLVSSLPPGELIPLRSSRRGIVKYHDYYFRTPR